MNIFATNAKRKLMVSRHIADEFNIDENDEYVFDVLVETDDIDFDDNKYELNGGSYLYNDDRFNFLKYKTWFLESKLKLLSINNISK